MIDPETIRKRLEEVWTQLGEQAGQAGHELMRACALTLIAVHDEEADPEGVARTLAELMKEHPSRTIAVRLAAGDSPTLEAEVEARCWLGFGGRQQICSELIAVSATESTLRDVPGAILPLVVADLPVVLWCSSRRAWGAGCFHTLAAPADRILVDTFGSPDPGQALAAVAGEARRSRVPVMDLAWTRLTRWRALLAQVFEKELYRRRLPSFSDLLLQFEAPPEAPVPTTALLMAGWVTSRLNNGRCRLGFERRPVDAGPARLTALRLRAEGDPALQVDVSRASPALGQVRIEVAGRDAVLNRCSLPPSTDVSLLAEELRIRGPDPVFHQSLERALDIVRTHERPVA